MYKYTSAESAVGTWIDGKVLYRKCWQVTVNSTNFNFSSGITYSSIDTVIDISCLSNCSVGKTSTYYDTNTSDMMRIWLNPNGQFTIKSGSSNPPRNYTAVVLMLYTKV